MRKVLFLTYHFPPTCYRGAGIRAEKFVKYLSRNGWKATVLTSVEDSPTGDEIFENVVRIQSLLPFSRPYNLRPYGWAIRAAFAARKLLAEEEFELIFVTAPPFLPAVSASWVRRITGVPLVVDFRDAWVLSPYAESGTRVNRFLSRFVFPRLEKYVLRLADVFVANTPSMLKEYCSENPFLEHKSVLIPNGFDEEDFARYAPSHNKKEFTLLYCGRFGISERSPELLLHAIKLLLDRGLSVQLRILGDSNPETTLIIEQFGLTNNVFVNPPVNPEQMVHAMETCGALVLIQAPSGSDVQPIAGKTYEYLRTGKPILSIAPVGDNTDLIRKYCRSALVVTSYQIEEVAAAITQLFSCWRDGRAEESPPDSEFVARYNREALTLSLIEAFERISRNDETTPGGVASI